MKIEEVKNLMEEAGIDQNKIEEFFLDIEKNHKEAERKDILDRIAIEWELKMKMDAENDWRKKAAFAAQIISLNLEEK